MSGLTMGSLFDGIGGFPLAAIRSGITPVWASEIEAFPIEVTKQRFPSMIHVGDITKLNGAELPPVDIICGGMPTVKIWSVISRSQIKRKMRICVEPMPFSDAAALPMSLL